jgi:hypothetical protein
MASALKRERVRAAGHGKPHFYGLSTIVLALLLAIVLGGCAKSATQATFVMKDSSSASLLQWTRIGHTVSGSLALAALDNATLDSKNLAFTGTISGSSVTLAFPQGFGARTNVVGTISGSHLRISLPVGDGSLDEMDFSPGTVAAYNTAVAVLTSQTDQARDSAVEWGLRSLEIGIQSYAVDNNDTYPADVTKASLVDNSGQPYVDNWPKNPYTDAPMAPGADAGDYSYTTNGTTFQLVGYGSDGTPVITLP